MKIHVTREWSESRLPAEEGHEIGAGCPAVACSRLSATPETDAYLARISAGHATWDALDQWATACNLLTEHGRKMERERDAIAINAAREIADLRETLRQIIAHDGPGFPHGTCARIAGESLDPENATVEARREVPPNPSDD